MQHPCSNNRNRNNLTLRIFYAEKSNLKTKSNNHKSRLQQIFYTHTLILYLGYIYGKGFIAKTRWQRN